jgi:hypothetical protein
MDLSSLDPALINKIILYQRPTYPYLKELHFFSDWFDGEDAFSAENKIRWTFDAIKLRNDIERDFLVMAFWRNCDIAGNYLRV